ncbi:MAG TPA: hypothetical protein VGO61_01425 [Steroidobacteraceae bacterium]|jgi:hypothetical protein|nr:hypothetical protein [Steroidobacteraceae bacterium]
MLTATARNCSTTAKDRRRARFASLFPFALFASITIGTTPVRANEIVEHTDSPAISFEWVDCEDARAPQVTVDLWKDGQFRYVGSAKVREMGEQRGVMSAGDAKRIISLGTRLANRSRIPSIPLTAEGDPTYPYCVRIAAKQGLGQRRGIIASFEKRARQFLFEVEQTVDVKHRVCPVRGSDEPLLFTPVDYCDESVVSLALADDEACASVRSVDIYRNGAVHQMATLAFTRTDGSVVRISVGDDYYLISPERASELWNLALTYEASHRSMTHATENPSHIFRGTPADLLSFKQALEGVVGIRWIPIEKPETGCGKDDRVPSVLLVAVK